MISLLSLYVTLYSHWIFVGLTNICNLDTVLQSVVCVFVFLTHFVRTQIGIVPYLVPKIKMRNSTQFQNKCWNNPTVRSKYNSCQTLNSNYIHFDCRDYRLECDLRRPTNIQRGSIPGNLRTIHRIIIGINNIDV